MFKKDGRADVLEDVNKLINEVLALVRSDIESQQLWVRTELFDKLPQIPANLVQLRQVLVNLIINSVEAISGKVVQSAKICEKSIHEVDQGMLRADHRGCLRSIGIWTVPSPCRQTLS
jgi:C4-dicarboxylate-specific signal transduction histidine kinase